MEERNKLITDRMMARMVHAIGLDNKKPKDGCYEAYRNYSCYNEPVEEWELLMVGGYAERRDRNEREVIYHLTKKGFQAVADAKCLLIRYTMEFEPNKNIIRFK